MHNIQCTGTMYGETLTVQQISKPAARKLFTAGGQIYAQTSNYRPFGIWQSLCCVTRLNEEDAESNKKHYDWCVAHGYKLPIYTPDADGQFNEFCDGFESYNCDNERGRYIHFYKRI